LANRLFFELSCVFCFLHLHFSHSDFDNNICLLNWGNANREEMNNVGYPKLNAEMLRVEKIHPPLKQIFDQLRNMHNQ
jgi:hypothetical protein